MRVVLTRSTSPVTKTHVVEIPRPISLVNGDTLYSITTPDGTVVLILSPREVDNLITQLRGPSR